MAAKERQRRRRESKAKKAWRLLRDAPTNIDDLPDDLLECVLLRLAASSPLCLIRAAFACKRFCRLVADARFRSLVDGGRPGGGPAVLGHYYTLNRPANCPHHPPASDPPFVPSSSSPPTGHCFSLDYLPFDRPRELIDSHGSLLLFVNGPRGTSWGHRHYRRFSDLLVCETLTRRFQGIARMPPPLGSLVFCGAYLIDGGGGERGVGMSNYRVLCMFGELACVFSPGSDGGWRFVDTGLKYGDGEDVEFPEDTQFVGRAAGKIYWWAPGGLVQVFDEATATFFLMEFPKHMRWEYHKSNLRVIGGVDGGGIRVVRMTGEDLEIYGESGGGEWAVERSVRLADATRGLPGRQEVFFTAEAPAARIVTAGGDGFVTLAPAEDETWLFSVDLETMEAERDHERNKHVGEAHPCSAPPLAAVFRACGVGDATRTEKSGSRL